MWILMHKNNPTHFRLLLSLSTFQLDHKSLALWYQPSPKKILPHLYSLELSQHINICTEKINFFPLNFGPSMLHALQISGLEIPDHRVADAFPTFFSQGFYSYHTGSITYQFHEQIPCTRCRRMHSNSQGWEGMFFQIQPHLPYSSALGKMHWSEPERMGFLLIFYQPLGIAPSHN